MKRAFHKECVLTDRGRMGLLVVGEASSSDEEPSSRPIAEGPLLTGHIDERMGGVALPAKDLADLQNLRRIRISAQLHLPFLF
mgnify:CR=1 FL=1